MNKTQPAECGTLAVPLDYTNDSSDATIDLQLFKIPALAES